MQKLFTLFAGVENRDSFFRRVHRFVLPYHEGALLIARAYQDAKEGFRGVKRKRGERYFEHPRAVALILMDILDVREPEEIAAALLHDHIEDLKEAGWTRERIADRYNERVAEYVAALTMPEGEFATREDRLHAFHAQIFAAPRAVIAIKFADRLHNLSTCDALSREAQWRMVEETRATYLPFAKEHGLLYEELCAMLLVREEMLNAQGGKHQAI